MIFSALNTPIGGVQVLFKHQNERAFPLDLACFECLNVIVAIQLQLMNNYLRLNPYASFSNPMLQTIL
jgi:hypothetical protein